VTAQLWHKYQQTVIWSCREQSQVSHLLSINLLDVTCDYAVLHL